MPKKNSRKSLRRNWKNRHQLLDPIIRKMMKHFFFLCYFTDAEIKILKQIKMQKNKSQMAIGWKSRAEFPFYSN